MKLKKFIKKHEVDIRLTGLFISTAFVAINLIQPSGTWLNIFIGFIAAGIFAFVKVD